MTSAGLGKTVVLVDHPVGKRDDRVSRILAEHGFATEWVRISAGETAPEPGPDYAGAVVYGGPESVNDLTAYPYLKDEMDWIETWIAAEKPFLGICLGAQLLARVLGAPVSRHPEGLHEIGYVEIQPTSSCGFLPAPLSVYHWHNEGFEVPRCAQRLAAGPVFPNQAFRYGQKAYGIQFHPEVCQAVMQRWIREAGEMLAEPGAQTMEQQLDGVRRHDKAMLAWLEGFLDRWLDLAPGRRATA